MEVPEQTKVSYEDYLEFNDDKRYEILDGELRVVPAPGVSHQRSVGRLFRLLTEYSQSFGGEVFLSPIDVVLSEHDVVQPDLVFVSKERADIVKEAAIMGAPDLVVEIISRFSRRVDRVAKKQRYAALGVRYYWIVDPQARTVEEYELTGGDYRFRSRAAGEEVFCPAIFPGLEITPVQLL